MTDIPSTDWSETDASNSQAVPNGWPEGMNPSAVNDAARMMMGATKRWYSWTVPKTTAGTATAFTLTYTVAPAALVDQMTHVVRFNAANGTAATLNVNGLGAKPLYYHSAGAWRVAPPALWDADEIFEVTYDSTATAYFVRRPGAARTGTPVPFAGSSAPGGFILASGQAISRTAYVGLFTVLGTTYGSGDGSTTFNLPDYTGRVVAGKEATATRLTTAGGGVDGGTLGATGGTESVTLTANEQASMTVTSSTTAAVAKFTADGSSVLTLLSDGSGTNLYNGTVSVTGGTASGGGNPHKNVQPTIIQNYMIAL
jgi:microcystin-dependent protein